MFKKMVEVYKIPLLISLTLSIILISLRLERQVISMLQIIIGVFLGTFVYDLDYILYAYFLEPEKDFSKTLRGYIKHKDFTNAVTYIYHHKHEVKDKTLHTAFFQVILAGVALLAVSSVTIVLVKALIVSTFANSIYRYADYFFNGRLDSWFWAIKVEPTKETAYGYGMALILALIFIITLF